MLNERVGELVEVNGRQRLRTEPGQGGHAVYGPYASLEPGKYCVEFCISPLRPADGDRDPLIAVIDVTAGVTTTLFDAQVFRSHLENDERYRVYFEIDRPLSGVEYRVYVNGAEPLLIDDVVEAVQVQRVEASPQRAGLPGALAEHDDRIRAIFFSGASVVARGTALVITLAGVSVIVKGAQDLRALESLATTAKSKGEPEPDEGHTAALVIVLGAHAPFGEVGYDLVGLVMNEIYGGHRRAHLTSLAELRILWEEHKGRPILLTTDCPDTALSYLLTTSNFPIFAFFDDPADAVVYRAVVESVPLPDAIRFCSRSFSCLIGCTASEHVLAFSADRYSWRLGELIAAILDGLGVAADPSLTARVMQRLCAAHGLEPQSSVGDFVRHRSGGQTMAELAEDRFDPDAQALIHEFAASYGMFLAGREDKVVEWPLGLFYTGANGEPGDRFVDLIGAARYIFFGPYLHLPLGGWRALVQFEVIGNLSGNEIEADVWVPSSQTAIANSVTRLPVQGHFQFTLKFVVSDPNAMLEIRVRLIKGAIEGRFCVRRVTLQSVSSLEEITGATAAPALQAPQLSAS